MKILFALLLVYISSNLTGAQTTSLSPVSPETAKHALSDGNTAKTLSDSPYTMVSKGANERVWQRTAYEILPSGQTIPRIHRYTEIATGLNFWDSTAKQWVESSEGIDILPNGTAAATHGQHQAYFPGDIYNGVITLITPEGRRLQSRPLGLSYDDGTNMVLIAELTNSVGYLVGSNQVVYPDAFTDFKADLRYTYTKAGFEQDIILRASPFTPESYGLDPATTRLQELTEFFNPPQPAVRMEKLPKQAGIALNDENLDFGVMKMAPGRAFLLGSDAHEGSAQVGKSWVELEGRQFLVEEVPVEALADELAQLPAAQMSSIKPVANSVRNVVSAKRLLPTQRSVAAGQAGQFRQVTQASAPSRGLVLDYVTFNSNQTNYVFKADSTYFISGSFFSSGTNTFEGNTVLKFATNGSISLVVGPGPVPSINWKAGAYRPVIFTAKDDNSVGESVGTGNPTGYYGNPCLWLAGFTPSAPLSGLRVSYAKTALQFSSITASIYDAQFVNCQNGLNLSSATVFLGNALFANTVTNFIGGTVNAQNTTISGSLLLVKSASLALTNCILANVTNLVAGSVTTNGNNNGFYNCLPLGIGALTNTFNPFQAVGAGNYYLASGCNFTNSGTAGIDSTLLADLQKKTTYPPVLYSNLTISVATNFLPQAQRDTDTLDLGYHYDPIDYIADLVAITNATLTLSNGTAVACYNEPGINLQDGSTIISIGTPLTPNWLVRYQSVQEQPLLLGGVNVSSGQNVAATPSIGPVPTGTFRFSKFACPAGGGTHLYDNGVTNYGNLLIQDCEFWDGQNNFTGSTNTTATLKNNLFYRSSITAIATNLLSTLSLSNNLIYGTAVALLQPTNTIWYAFNNDFDNCGITNSTLTNGYNGYVNSSGRLNPNNAFDVVLSGFTYTNGPLGGFYQFSANLVDKGSCTADLTGLYHYTTQTSEVKETNSIVDIGYHYVAVDQYGNPIDSNGNGIPDYLEDANGAGQALTITLIAPTYNAYYAEPATIPIQATVLDWSSVVTNVSFYWSTTQITVFTNAPYQYNWPIVAAGSYLLTATASDLAGSGAVSTSVSVTVTNLCSY